MAGSEAMPSTGPHESSDTQTHGQAKTPSGAKAKTFSCPNCGASVTIRYPGGALSVSCPSCKSIISTSNEQYRIVQQYDKTTGVFNPVIELGARGKLKGKTWECIGFLIRQDKASGFYWHEYLLFNPYYGYRWLTFSNGHFNFVTPLRSRLRPVATISGLARVVESDERTYKLFYSGKASIKYVLGEFYWQVRTGWAVEMEDFVSPPYMLSSERDENELTWSKSEYIKQSEVRDAFKIKKNLPSPIGIAPNQPNPSTQQWKSVKPLWMVFLVFLTAMQCLQLMRAANFTAYHSVNTFIPQAKTSDALTTPVFTLPIKKGNVLLSVSADVDNNWFWLGGELVNNKTGESYPFERTVEYYHGYTDGESWSEGSTVEKILLTGVPEGEYYINVDTESGGAFRDANPKNWELTVKRNVPTYANYFTCLLLGSLLPLFVWLASRRAEVARWADSDYSPYERSSGDD